jgi:hypothetical protein
VTHGVYGDQMVCACARTEKCGCPIYALLQKISIQMATMCVTEPRGRARVALAHASRRKERHGNAAALHAVWKALSLRAFGACLRAGVETGLDALGQRALALVVPALRTVVTKPDLFVDALDHAGLAANNTLEQAALNVALHRCFCALVRRDVASIKRRDDRREMREINLATGRRFS